MYLCCMTICVNIVLRIVFTSVLKLNIQRHIYDTQSNDLIMMSRIIQNYQIIRVKMMLEKRNITQLPNFDIKFPIKSKPIVTFCSIGPTNLKVII